MRKFCVLLTILLTAAASGHALSERTKIQLLLDSIEKSQLTFIRNGKKYTSLEARKHLEMKLKKSWVTIDSAVKFIDYIATKSYLSGTYYLVELKDGTTIKTAQWLKSLLKKIESHETEKQ